MAGDIKVEKEMKKRETKKSEQSFFLFSLNCQQILTKAK